MTTSHQCYVVNEHGQTYRCNGTWGPYSKMTLLFPNAEAMKTFFTHSKIKPCLRWL